MIVQYAQLVEHIETSFVYGLVVEILMYKMCITWSVSHDFPTIGKHEVIDKGSLVVGIGSVRQCA